LNPGRSARSQVSILTELLRPRKTW